MDNEERASPNENENLRRDVLAVLSAQMQTHERYHTQKESMTWLVALAYVGAAMVLVGREPFWREWPIQWFAAWVVLLLITAIAVISFLYWQFRNRSIASAFFNCCADVAAQCLHSSLAKEELAPVPLRQLSDMLVPAAVEKRFKERFTGKFSWPQTLTMAVSVLWTIGAGIYVLLMYEGLCKS
jgi:hypothetical protein